MHCLFLCIDFQPIHYIENIVYPWAFTVSIDLYLVVCIQDIYFTPHFLDSGLNDATLRT